MDEFIETLRKEAQENQRKWESRNIFIKLKDKLNIKFRYWRFVDWFNGR